jgi:hypothetical protein
VTPGTVSAALPSDAVRPHRYGAIGQSSIVKTSGDGAIDYQDIMASVDSLS